MADLLFTKMTTPIFEEGSLESEIVNALLQYGNRKMREMSFDVYRIFGVLVQPELTVNYRIDDVIWLANYIRTEESKGNYIFQTLEYLPQAYDIEQR